MFLSPFVPSVIFGRIPKSLKMVPRPPQRTLVKTLPFFFSFFSKVHQTALKSMHVSPFVCSVIFGRIPKSLKMIPRRPPCALVKTPLFFFFFMLKVRQTALKSMHVSTFERSLIFGRIPKSLKMVHRPTPLAF